jgi:hypothetical protein
MKETFYTILNAAIKDLLDCGFDSEKRVAMWRQRIEVAARQLLIPEDVMQRKLRDALTRDFTRLINGNTLLKRHSGISQYTLAAIKPKLRAELDRRILASANLIKLNRAESIERTLKRFSGWATSIPIGGTSAPEAKEGASKIRKSITSLPFEERRVIVDQGHKLTSAVSDIVAVDGGAIAMRWRHVKERSKAYTPREEHLERDGVVYVIRDNWASKKGFVKLAGHQYTDQVTKPGEEVFCRCTGEYIYNLRDLPAEMVTKAGRDELERVRTEIRRWKAA